jgi:hypothetical protein
VKTLSCEDTQHSVLIANLNRQGYREVKLHVILVGVFGTIVGMLDFITGIITAGYHGNHKISITSDYNADRASNR